MALVVPALYQVVVQEGHDAIAYLSAMGDGLPSGV